MKKHHMFGITAVCISLLFCGCSRKTDYCALAYEKANEGGDNIARIAFNMSQKLDVAKMRAKDAIDNFTEAKKAAEKCGCQPAVEHADAAITILNRAESAANLEEMSELARLARYESNDAQQVLYKLAH